MVGILNQIILALAHADHMVIIGRSSFAVLAGYADVLNVRIQAPLPTRIQQVAQRPNTRNLAHAETLVIQSDKARASFIEGFYGSRWDITKSFDLVIDTGKISQNLAADWLIEAVRGLSKEPLVGAHSLDTIQVVLFWLRLSPRNSTKHQSSK
jgi:cytidylate kinase